MACVVVDAHAPVGHAANLNTKTEASSIHSAFRRFSRTVSLGIFYCRSSEPPDISGAILREGRFPYFRLPLSSKRRPSALRGPGAIVGAINAITNVKIEEDGL